MASTSGACALRGEVARAGVARAGQRARGHVCAPLRAAAPAKEGPILIDGELLHSCTAERIALLEDLSRNGFVENEVGKYLKPTQECWQPQDYLPDPESESFMDEVRELRERALELPDEYLVALVGDMITEEALPTYMTMLNTLDGVRDRTGASDDPWAKWTRQWTAEENRHGDLLNKYLYLTGRVDMRAIEVTIQNLIGSGMSPKTENNAYMGFVYTSFQERATKVSHGNTGFQARKAGDKALAEVCGVIAADEHRHEQAYSTIMDELFRVDPDGAMLAFGDMMRKQIVMPAHMMEDGVHAGKNNGRDLFSDFSTVAEKLGIYTAQDYASIMEHLIDRWDCNNLTGLSAEALKEQQYVCALPTRVRKLADRAEARKAKVPPVEMRFSWISDRTMLV